ncbi:MAG: hypothetical protein HQL52_02750 [Magnetococcales bacterium]|nr:hypothetical protein [Magnetococcales bacterium]
MSDSDNDYDTRFQVIDPKFTPEEDRVYETEMAALKRRIKGGDSWNKAVKQCKLDDGELKKIILEDFLKITVAERHFQGGDSLKKVAKTLKVSLKDLMAIKESMLKEVQAAAVKAYHLQQPKPN